MLNFTNTNMLEIITILETLIQKTQPIQNIEFEVLNPDLYDHIYSGTTLDIEGQTYIHRSYKSWLDLAQQLHCKLLTPKVIGKYTIFIKFQLLNSDASFHKQIEEKEEKYGSESIFSQIHKNEESAFIYAYKNALLNASLDKRIRILNLGVNSGDEFEVIAKYAQDFSQHKLLGIDYCASAIQEAKEKFREYANIEFLQHDINDLESLNLEKFDLIISIGTLQSSNLEFNPLLMSIVQNQLKRDGAMILGFPNCRWVDGEMIYGAKVKNYAFSEMGLVFKDAIFAKKYLQQKKYRVTLTGKDYIFLTATSIR